MFREAGQLPQPLAADPSFACRVGNEALTAAAPPLGSVPCSLQVGQLKKP
jgi:hypothetical protein